jgi:serine carboxypeptidase 1
MMKLVLVVLFLALGASARQGQKHGAKYPVPNPQRTQEQAQAEAKDADFVPHSEECAGTEDGTEKWCYVNVRPGAHSFYWLYYSTHADGWQTRPLVLWLQGGPGASSTGYGNFEIIGPLDLDLEPRETTWVQTANVLFVDNPIGSGYSYAETDDDLTETTDEISEDLYALMKDFLSENPDFQTTPFWIFGQSYGGKMGVAFAERLQEGIDAGDINCNLGGYAMGNSWIHPVASTLSWAPFLYYMSNLDEYGYTEVMEYANNAAAAAAAGDWEESTDWWAQTEYRIWDLTNYVDFYNILQYEGWTREQRLARGGVKPGRDEFGFGLERAARTNESLAQLLKDVPEQQDVLDDLMNGPIKEKLGIIPEGLVWGAQSGTVFNKQAGHFMRPVVDVLGRMLTNYPNVKGVVYQGALDLICDTKGANDYVQMLGEHWGGLDDFNQAERFWTVNEETRQTELFYKAHTNLYYYWVLMAGHAVPKDQGWPALNMLNRIIDDVDAYP